MRVVATRIEPDGTMQRHVVDTARRDDGPRWEDLAAHALAPPPPYCPVLGTAVYHTSLGDHLVQYDLGGPLRDLVTVTLAMRSERAQRFWQSWCHVLPRSGTAFDRSDIGEAHQIAGSQTGRADSSDRCNTRVVRELRWQVAEGRAGRHRAIIESGLRG